MKLAEQDLAHALETYSEYNDSAPADAAKSIVQVWAKQDPKAALAWAEEIADERTKEEALIALLKVWWPDDLEEAGRLAAQLDDRARDDHPSIAIAQDLAAADPVQAIDWATEHLTNNLFRGFVSKSMREHVKDNAMDKAIALMNALPTDRESAARNFIPPKSELPEASWMALVKAMNAVEPHSLREAFAHGIFRVIPQELALSESLQSLVTDLTLLEAVKPLATRSLVPSTIQSAQVFQETLESVQQLPATDQEPHLAKLLGRLEPERAIEQLHLLPQGTARTEAVGTIAWGWAAYDPQEAAAWAAQLPQEEQTEAYENLARRWSEHDSYAASQWISTLQEGRARDTAIGQMLVQLDWAEPDSAFTWAGSITNSVARGKALEHTIKNWNLHAPEEARAAVIGSALDPDIQAKLLRVLDQ